MPINVLSEEIINQIAAGEVIENPAAVIKELIENSLDAKTTTQILVEIEDSGFKKIIVSDNGSGISKSDLVKAPLRHATSKISSFEDLYSIKSMGFRGEALASIFSVSKAKIISKQNNSPAYEISNDGIVKESARGQGTTVIVEDLFFNTPARKKYLKSKTLELKNILDIIRRFEIFHKEISIQVKHNGKIIVDKPQFSSDIENFCYITGLQKLRDQVIPIKLENTGISIEGFFVNPSVHTYAYKKNQYFYVNSRYVKSKVLLDGLYSGFGSNLMVGRHPIFCIKVSIDPEIIDVNVHPTKIEIRFENEAEVYENIKVAISRAFEKNLFFKDEKISAEKNFSLDSKVDLEVSSKKFPKREEKSYFVKDFQKALENLEVERKERIHHSSETEIESSDKNQKEYVQEDYGPLYDEFREYKILGQLDKTYIVMETKDGLVLVDQHVADEKYLYEELKKKHSQRTVPIQKVLKPYLLELDSSDFMLFKENKEVLLSLGFDVEEFGGTSVIVRSLPLTLRNSIMDPETIKEILHSLFANKDIRVVEEEQHSKIASMACRMAVMAGDELTYPQMKAMIEKLKKLKQPFHCPHGRPTFLRYQFKDLQKKFKRIV